MDAFARSFRRAGLPVRMSQGFHPRPRFSLPVPLALGIEGLDEVLEIDLNCPLDADVLVEKLGQATPDGIDILSARPLEPGQKARPHSTTYRVYQKIDPQAVDRLLAGTECRVKRRDGKEVDIRPFIKHVSPCDRGCEFELLVTSAGTAKPREVVDELLGEDADPPPPMTRTAVNLEPSPNKELSGT